MRVTVKDNNVQKACRKLKKLLHNEGVIQELLEHRYFVKPSEVKRMKRKEAIRRHRNEVAKRQARGY